MSGCCFGRRNISLLTVLTYPTSCRTCHRRIRRRRPHFGHPSIRAGLAHVGSRARSSGRPRAWDLSTADDQTTVCRPMEPSGGNRSFQDRTPLSVRSPLEVTTDVGLPQRDRRTAADGCCLGLGARPPVSSSSAGPVPVPPRPVGSGRFRGEGDQEGGRRATGRVRADQGAPPPIGRRPCSAPGWLREPGGDHRLPPSLLGRSWKPLPRRSLWWHCRCCPRTAPLGREG